MNIYTEQRGKYFVTNSFSGSTFAWDIFAGLVQQFLEVFEYNEKGKKWARETLETETLLSFF